LIHEKAFCCELLISDASLLLEFRMQPDGGDLL